RLRLQLLDSSVDSGDLRLESVDASCRRAQLDESVANRRGFAGDPVAHLHAHSIHPLAKSLGAASAEQLFYLERCRSCDGVAWKTLRRPLRCEGACVAFENAHFALEPGVRRLGDLVNAADFGDVLRRRRPLAPRDESSERVTQLPFDLRR